MTLTQMNYILAVAKHRQFAVAAKSCHVSQPTLSVGIQKVEDELGVMIFDRKRQPITPTPIGNAIIEQARIVLREASRLQEVVKKEKHLIQGEYRLDIIPTVAGSLVPLFLQKFFTAHPKVALHVEEQKTEDMIERLLNDEVDAGIAATPLGYAELEEQPLYHEPFYLYLSEKNDLLKKGNIRQSDLKDRHIWLLGEGHCFRHQVEYLCQLRSEQKSNEPINFESGNFQTLMKLVDQGVGMTLLPYLVAKELRGKQKTHLREFVDPMPMRQISLIYRGPHVKKGVTHALAESIQSSIPSVLLGKTSGQVLPPIEAR